MARKGYRNVSIRSDVAQELSALAKREGLEISDMVNSLIDNWGPWWKPDQFDHAPKVDPVAGTAERDRFAQPQQLPGLFSKFRSLMGI